MTKVVSRTVHYVILNSRHVTKEPGPTWDMELAHLLLMGKSIASLRNVISHVGGKSIDVV